jgi:alkyldihydroxyacetonephosphate synthase
MGEHVFVMAHLSHAYPDGCCIYFSFAGSAQSGTKKGEWDASCESVYDATWRSALDAAVASGGTLAHHHGVGRSKAPRLGAELGKGVDVTRALMRAFDPQGILNPGSLIPRADDPKPAAPAKIDRPNISIDTLSLLAEASGETTMGEIEKSANAKDLTLGLEHSETDTLADFLAHGAHGKFDAWKDPADHLVAGFEATLKNGGELLIVRPAPRRAVGPDLFALAFGMEHRIVNISRAWIRLHRRDATRRFTETFSFDRDPPLEATERAWVETVAQAVAKL